MKKKKIAVPTVIAIAVTRGLAGLGAGLLLSPRIPKDQRKKLGLALVGLGAVTTIPLVKQVFRG
jgi:hypothetical protein